MNKKNKNVVINLPYTEPAQDNTGAIKSRDCTFRLQHTKIIIEHYKVD